MAAKRLYAFRNALIILLAAMSCTTAFFLSCAKDKKPDISVGRAMTSVSKPYFVTEIEKTEEAKVINPHKLLYDRFLWGENELAYIAEDRIYTYDETRNAYVLSHRLKTPLQEMKGVHEVYLCDNKVCAYDDETLAPNLRHPILSLNGIYYGLFIDPETSVYFIIISDDLKTWRKSGVENRAPILLFRQDGEMYALVDDTFFNEEEHCDDFGTKVFRVYDAKEIRRVPWKIMETNDKTLFYVFNFDDYIVLQFRRIYESPPPGNHCMIINTRNLSFLMSRSKDSVEIGPYNYKVIKRVDGWKIYYIGSNPEDGIKVVDPFAEGVPEIKTNSYGRIVDPNWYEGGPQIIETLNGIIVPES